MGRCFEILQFTTGSADIGYFKFGTEFFCPNITIADTDLIKYINL